jgi:hypothetical protein
LGAQRQRQGWGKILQGEDEEEGEGTGNGRVGANHSGLLRGDALDPASGEQDRAEEPPPP